jgi:hypothetical protein
LEREVPGVRYGLVLLLALGTFLFMAVGPAGSWQPLATTILESATLVAALVASEAGRFLVRLSLVVIAGAVVGGLVVLFQGTSNVEGYTPVLSFLVVGVAPVAVGTSIWRRRMVDVQTVLGAISIYVFLGLFFAFVYQSVGVIGPDAFFAQQATATVANYVYFSFSTITTLGYGDLTAAHGLGRALAVSEAMFGQVYLFTIIALLVSQLAGRLRPNADPNR